MRVSCEKSSLLEAINIVSKAISVKSSTPILEGVLLKTIENGIYLMGNNLEIAIECKIDAIVEESGSIVLENKLLTEILRKIGNGEVTISVDENQNTTIQSLGLDYRLKGMPATEFPDIPHVEEDHSFRVPSVLMKNMIKQTIFNIDETQSRKILCGALFKFKDNTLHIVTASQNRLSVRREYLQDTAESEHSFVVPGKSLSELLKILKDTEESVSIFVTNKYVMFECEDFKMVTRLIEGAFLEYENYLPKNMKYETKVVKQEILEKTEQCEPVVQSSGGILIPVVYKFDFDTISIRSVTNLNSYMGVVSMDKCEANMEIGFNYKYLTEAIKAVDAENLVFKLNSEKSPFIIEAENSDRFTYMVLPVILHNGN